MRMRLENVVDPATIAQAFSREYGALTWNDLELLATIEDLHREINSSEAC